MYIFASNMFATFKCVFIHCKFVVRKSLYELWEPNLFKMLWFDLQKEKFLKDYRFPCKKTKKSKKSGSVCCGSGDYRFSENDTDPDPDPDYRPNPNHNIVYFRSKLLQCFFYVLKYILWAARVFHNFWYFQSVPYLLNIAAVNDRNRYVSIQLIVRLILPDNLTAHNQTRHFSCQQLTAILF